MTLPFDTVAEDRIAEALNTVRSNCNVTGAEPEGGASGGRRS